MCISLWLEKLQSEINLTQAPFPIAGIIESLDPSEGAHRLPSETVLSMQIDLKSLKKAAITFLIGLDGIACGLHDVLCRCLCRSPKESFAVMYP